MCRKLVFMIVQPWKTIQLNLQNLMRWYLHWAQRTFCQNDRFRAGGCFNPASDSANDTLSSPSDIPPYTASTDDVTHGTRPLTKREKREKAEKQDKDEDSDPGDLNTTKVEPFQEKKERVRAPPPLDRRVS